MRFTRFFVSRAQLPQQNANSRVSTLVKLPSPVKRRFGVAGSAGPLWCSVHQVVTACPNQLTKESPTIAVRGWIRTVRKQKSVAFVSLFDGTSCKDLQVVLHPEQAKR